jgi:hypothetical protein
VPIGDNAVAAGSIGVNNLVDTALTFGVSALDAGAHGAIVTGLWGALILFVLLMPSGAADVVKLLSHQGGSTRRIRGP